MTKKSIEYFMRQAIIEGRKALPKCLPNPPVGCVIVADGKIVSRGHTNEPGKPHAEAMALQLLDSEIENFTMFVTLEPCSFQGRTPSCAKAIAAQKERVKSIYVGMIDSHPKNQGTGITILKAANIAVEVGVLLEEVKKDLEDYLIVG